MIAGPNAVMINAKFETPAARLPNLVSINHNPPTKTSDFKNASLNIPTIFVLEKTVHAATAPTRPPAAFVRNSDIKTAGMVPNEIKLMIDPIIEAIHR